MSIQGPDDVSHKQNQFLNDNELLASCHQIRLRRVRVKNISSSNCIYERAVGTWHIAKCWYNWQRG